MIEIMSIVAIVVGILFGFWCFSRQTISWLFVILHTSAFSTKKGFYELYDMADDEVTFSYYKVHNKDVKNYADYLKIHSDARPTAYKTLKSTYDALSKSLLFKTIPIALAPAILFWANWYFYLLGVAIIVACLIGYEVARNGLRPGYYQRLIVFNSLNKFYKDKIE